VSDHGAGSHSSLSASRFNDALSHTNLVRFGAPLPTGSPTPTTTPTVPVTTTTGAPPPTTTTTEAPLPPVTTTAEAPAPASVVTSGGNSESGEATYYASYFPAGGCASPDLPKGTVLTVTTASGASVVCTVDDLEATNPGRVVDLSPAEFSELAPLSQGVVGVTVSW
jgi:rare lipoprotein A